MTSRIPLGTLGRPGDIAEAILYLASDRSSFVTGADILVDGGMASCIHWGEAGDSLQSFHSSGH